ncbi:hypothetical protein DSO57_1014527 [Entomophthora muscae]|uniref:Uncharacterized protein n=1 Tax=Entomophthora muscae TaxID=34485 RepID=A0ACC2U353_9FUNG|nr:hypothetical protein DSO57_1014527 [Entomophthora muscae]
MTKKYKLYEGRRKPIGKVVGYLPPKEWEKVTRHLEMTDRGREFIGAEFTRLLKYWYWPTEGLAPTEVQVYGGDAHLLIGKVLEEFALMKAKYKLLTNHSPLLGNDNSSKLVPGYDQGHILGTGDQEPHNHSQLLLAKSPYTIMSIQ